MRNTIPFDILFTEEGKNLIVGTNDGFVRVFDVMSGDLIIEQQVLLSNSAEVTYRIQASGDSYPEIGGVYTLTLNQDGSLLLAAGVDGQFVLIETKNWGIVQIQQLATPFDITEASFDATGNYASFSSRGRERSIAEWNVGIQKETATRNFNGLYDRVEGIAYYHLDSRLIVLGYPRYIALIDGINDENKFIQFTFDVRNFSVARISSNGELIARSGFAATGDEFTDGLPFITQSDNKVYIYRTAELLNMADDLNSPVGLCYAFKESNGGTTVPVNCPIAKPFWTLEGHEDVVTSINFDRANKYVVTGSDDGTVKVWIYNH